MIPATNLFFYNTSCFKFSSSHLLVQSSRHVQFLKTLLFAEESYIELKISNNLLDPKSRKLFQQNETVVDDIANSREKGFFSFGKQKKTLDTSSSVTSSISSSISSSKSSSVSPSISSSVSGSIPRNQSILSLSESTNASSSSVSGLPVLFKFFSGSQNSKSNLKSIQNIHAQKLYEECLSYLSSDNITIADSEVRRSEKVELSRKLVKDLKLYLNFKIEMISLYQGLISFSGKIINFSSFKLTLKTLKQKYLNNPANVHPFLERIFFNAKMEFDIISHLIEASEYISKLEYVGSTMKLFQLDREFDKWSTKLFSIQNTPDDQSDSPAFNSPPAKSLRRIGTTSNIPTLLKEKLSSAVSPSFTVSSEEIFDEQSPNGSRNDHNNNTHLQQTKKSLESFTLIRFLLQMYKFCVSKYSWYFHRTLRKNPTNNQNFSKLMKDRVIIHYTEWISNFYKQTNPEYIFLVYNATNDEGCSPPVVESGYSLLHNCERKIEKTQGIRQWPCIYYYPQDSNENTFIYSHWPTLLTLFQENDSVLNQSSNAYVFHDRILIKTYFISKLDERIFFCITYKQIIETKAKNFKQIQDFVSQLNSYTRNTKLFSIFS